MRIPHIQCTVFIFSVPKRKANQGHGSSGQAPMQCISAPIPSAFRNCANRRSSTVSTGLSTAFQSISPAKSAQSPYCPQFPQIIHKHPPQPQPMWKSRPSCLPMSFCSMFMSCRPSSNCIFIHSFEWCHIFALSPEVRKTHRLCIPGQKTPCPSRHVHMTIIFRGYTEASP